MASRRQRVKPTSRSPRPAAAAGRRPRPPRQRPRPARQRAGDRFHGSLPRSAVQPSSSARTASSTRDNSPYRSKSRLRWLSTVRSDSPRALPTSAFVEPPMTRSIHLELAVRGPAPRCPRELEGRRRIYGAASRDRANGGEDGVELGRLVEEAGRPTFDRGPNERRLLETRQQDHGRWPEWPSSAGATDHGGPRGSAAPQRAHRAGRRTTSTSTSAASRMASSIVRAVPTSSKITGRLDRGRHGGQHGRVIIDDTDADPSCGILWVWRLAVPRSSAAERHPTSMADSYRRRHPVETRNAGTTRYRQTRGSQGPGDGWRIDIGGPLWPVERSESAGSRARSGPDVSSVSTCRGRAAHRPQPSVGDDPASARESLVSLARPEQHLAVEDAQDLAQARRPARRCRRWSSRR